MGKQITRTNGQTTRGSSAASDMNDVEMALDVEGSSPYVVAKIPFQPLTIHHDRRNIADNPCQFATTSSDKTCSGGTKSSIGAVFPTREGSSVKKGSYTGIVMVHTSFTRSRPEA